MACDMQSQVAAYLLDALEPDETQTMRAHLADCAICQDEVVKLSPIPALLQSVRIADLESLDDAAGEPAQLLETLLARAVAGTPYPTAPARTSSTHRRQHGDQRTTHPRGSRIRWAGARRMQ
jgi:hypothetical protein